MASALSPAQRRRKIDKLSRIRIELSADASNKGLTSSERMALARAADDLRIAIGVMTDETRRGA